MFVAGMTASFALDKGIPFANPQDWNKEEGKIVINAAEVSLIKATVGTNLRLVVESLFSRADATDENHLVKSSCPPSAAVTW